MARTSVLVPSTLRILAFAMALLVIVWMGFGLYVQYARQVQAERRARTEVLAGEMIERTKAAFGRVTLIKQDELSALRTYQNAAHVERARALGISVLKDRDAAQVLQQSEALVELTDNSYFVVEEMTHSVPYVTRSTAHLLTQIGMHFQAELRRAGLPPYRYVVTSGTRTMADQQRLRRTNVNAALTSSHFFGTTVDLHYRLFDFAADPTEGVPDTLDVVEELLAERLGTAYRELAHTRQQKLKAILGRTLLKLQQEGNVLVIYERLQPVYHITLGRELVEPQAQPVLKPAPPPEVAEERAPSRTRPAGQAMP